MHRLEWFELQAAAGLIGEIDRPKTRRGAIVCKDGFSATTLDEAAFRRLAADLDADVRVFTVDDSSLFLELKKH
jgi:2-polyprenyl-6-hydroxyphenyl methylase/3-demethylubiquinone-9 3-methyltransferase